VDRGGADGAGSAVPSALRRLYLSPHTSREGRGSFLGDWCGWRRNRGGEIEGGGARSKVVVVG